MGYLCSYSAVGFVGFATCMLALYAHLIIDQSSNTSFNNVHATFVSHKSKVSHTLYLSISQIINQNVLVIFFYAMIICTDFTIILIMCTYFIYLCVTCILCIVCIVSPLCGG